MSTQMERYLTYHNDVHAPAAPQIIYSLTPVWAALLAGLLLPQEEATGPLGWCGGGVIIAATLVLSLRDDKR
jgi:drug/metabolite transporter (DMT)-like permease